MLSMMRRVGHAAYAMTKVSDPWALSFCVHQVTEEVETKRAEQKAVQRNPGPQCTAALDDARAPVRRLLVN